MKKKIRVVFRALNLLRLPSKESEGVLGELVGTLAIPGAFGHANFLLSIHVTRRDAVCGDGEYGDLTSSPFELGLEVLFVADVDDSNIDISVLSQCGTDIQPGSVLDGADPLGTRFALIGTARNVRIDGPPSHILREQVQGPPDRLLYDTILGRHQGGNDIDALRNTGHPDVFALTHKDVEPDGHAQSVGEGIAFFSALVARSAHGVPHVPLVKADCGPRLVRRNTVLNHGKVDEGRGNLNRAFSGQGSSDIGKMSWTAGVEMDTVHVNERNAASREKRVSGKQAMLQCVVVP